MPKGAGCLSIGSSFVSVLSSKGIPKPMRSQVNGFPLMFSRLLSNTSKCFPCSVAGPRHSGSLRHEKHRSHRASSVPAALSRDVVITSEGSPVCKIDFVCPPSSLAFDCDEVASVILFHASNE